MIISAYLGPAGLTDVGYRFYTSAEAPVATRVTAGIVDATLGWYSADVTIPGTAASVRWDSAANPTTIHAREYLSASVTVDSNAIAAAVWQVLTSGLTAAGSVGKLVADNLNATVSSRSTYAGADTAGTTTLLSRIASALTITGGKVDVNDKTGFALTAAYDSAKTAAQVGSAMTLTSAYDAAKTCAQVGSPMTLSAAYDAAKTAATQASVNTIDARLDTEIPAILAAVDTEVAAIKAVTDKLDTALVLDGVVYQYTANALELGPVGGGGGGTGDASQATLLAVKAKTDALPSDPADASVIADSFTTTNAKIDAVAAKTNNLPVDPADSSDIAASFAGVNTKLDAISSGMPLDANELNAIADAFLKRDWTSVSGEASYSVLQALRILRCAWNTTGGVLTVKKEDSSTAWQRTLGTDPTAAPIVSST